MLIAQSQRGDGVWLQTYKPSWKQELQSPMQCQEVEAVKHCSGKANRVQRKLSSTPAHA